MIIRFKKDLSKLHYDCLQSFLQYLKEVHKIEYTLKFNKVILKHNDKNILRAFKSTLKNCYNKYF